VSFNCEATLQSTVSDTFAEVISHLGLNKGRDTKFLPFPVILLSWFSPWIQGPPRGALQVQSQAPVRAVEAPRLHQVQQLLHPLNLSLLILPQGHRLHLRLIPVPPLPSPTWKVLTTSRGRPKGMFKKFILNCVNCSLLLQMSRFVSHMAGGVSGVGLRSCEWRPGP